MGGGGGGGGCAVEKRINYNANKTGNTCTDTQYQYYRSMHKLCQAFCTLSHNTTETHTIFQSDKLVNSNTMSSNLLLRIPIISSET